MAILFKQQPQLYTPAYNRNQFVCFSTLAAAHADFVYKVQVTTPLAVLNYDYPKRPDNYGVFDVSGIVKNAIIHSFDPDSTTPYLAFNKSIKINVYVTESYGGNNYASISYDYYAFDACLKESVFKAYDFNDYVSGYTSPISFLDPNLNDPKAPSKYITTNNDLWLSFYLGACRSIDVTIYDELNALVGTLNFTVPTPHADEIYSFNVGNRALTQGGFPLSDGYTVEVSFKDSTPSEIHLLTYTINNHCSKYEKYTVYYLKRNGSIGFFNFDMLSQSSLSKSTNTVRIDRYKLTATALTANYGYNSYDREKHVVSTQVGKKTVLNSDWITQDQCDQLDELFDNPIAWISAPGNNGPVSNYQPVFITDQDYTINRHVNNKLFNYTINVEHDQLESRQRGI